MQTIKGNVAAPEARVAIIVARFNHFINDSLVAGAVDALTRIGQVNEDNISVIWVPGAFEIPLAAKAAAESNRYDAIVALGTVIRGSTAHFDYVAGESSSGLLNTSLSLSIPIGFGILTTENIEQAIERAGTKAGNKGAEAALTALEMVNLVKMIKE
ncbi:6,7-dimethyl-8-ribityllumazine synthase [Orbaceae bacterium ESL0721]|nr:6,7-dimethyl-8-ribityllumazine synthase [Orbaceae bacterium ESL0721]